MSSLVPLRSRHRRWRTVRARLATATVLLAGPFMFGAAVFQKHLLLIPIGLMTLLALAHLLAERLRRRRERRAEQAERMGASA